MTSSTAITGPEIRPNDSRTLSVEVIAEAGWKFCLASQGSETINFFRRPLPHPRTPGKQGTPGLYLYLFLAVQALPLQDTFSAMRVTPQVVTQSNRFPLSALRTRKNQLGPMVNIGLGRMELG